MKLIKYRRKVTSKLEETPEMTLLLTLRSCKADACYLFSDEKKYFTTASQDFVCLRPGPYARHFLMYTSISVRFSAFKATHRFISRFTAIWRRTVDNKYEREKWGTPAGRGDRRRCGTTLMARQRRSGTRGYQRAPAKTRKIRRKIQNFTTSTILHDRREGATLYRSS